MGVAGQFFGLLTPSSFAISTAVRPAASLMSAADTRRCAVLRVWVGSPFSPPYSRNLASFLALDTMGST